MSHMSMSPSSIIRLLISVMVYGQLVNRSTVQDLHQDILSSMMRMLPVTASWPTKVTYLDNFARNHHKGDTTRSPATDGRARKSFNGVAAPSSLPSSSSLPQPSLFINNAPLGIHSRPGGTSSTKKSTTTVSGSYTHKVSLFYIPWRLVRHGASFWTPWLSDL